MNFNDITQIQEAGFTGFKTMKELFKDSSIIPQIKGVYMVLNPTKKGEFLPVGTGGHFKRKDPNVSIDVLKLNWVDSLVVYIGQAGGGASNATLNSRLK